MDKYQLITFAGWEDRFILGARQIFSEKHISSVTLFYSKEFSHATAKNRTLFRRECQKKSTPLLDVEINFSSQKDTWATIWEQIQTIDSSNAVLVDISTMPREIIWYTLLALRELSITTDYVYHKPQEYGEWQTEDTDTPRLPLKLSGISDLQKKTLLFIITGYDPLRTAQICNYFEPERIYLAAQAGTQFDNQSKNLDAHKSIAKDINATLVSIEYCSPDCGKQAIIDAISDDIHNYNIILASLGPKISAIALFKIFCQHSEIALCYAPTKAINIDYSSGYSGSIYGAALPC